PAQRAGSRAAGTPRSSDPLLQVLQGAAQARRARRLADSEHACGARPVEVEAHAQGDDLALGGRDIAQRIFERAGQTVDELADELLTLCVGVLTSSAAGLCAEPVDGDVVRDLAQPGARRAPARVEAAPCSERLLERLGREILGGGTVAREVDEVAVHGVELLGHDLVEARARAERRWSLEGRRVHALLYGAAPAIRHMGQRR